MTTELSAWTDMAQRRKGAINELRRQRSELVKLELVGPRNGAPKSTRGHLCPSQQDSRTLGKEQLLHEGGKHSSSGKSERRGLTDHSKH